MLDIILYALATPLLSDTPQYELKVCVGLSKPVFAAITYLKTIHCKSIESKHVLNELHLRVMQLEKKVDGISHTPPLPQL